MRTALNTSPSMQKRRMLYIHPSPSHLSNFPQRSVLPFSIPCSRAEKMCLREDDSVKQLARAVTNLSVSMSGGETYATKRNSNVQTVLINILRHSLTKTSIVIWMSRMRTVVMSSGCIPSCPTTTVPFFVPISMTRAVSMAIKTMFLHLLEYAKNGIFLMPLNARAQATVPIYGFSLRSQYQLSRQDD